MIDRDKQLLKSIIRAIECLQVALDQHSEAIREQTKSGNSKDEPQPQPTIQSLNLPPEITEYYSAQNRNRPKDKAWSTVKRILHIGGLLVAAALAVLTYLTLNEVKRQADSAQAEVTAIQQQIVASERPWVSAKISLVQPRAFTKKGGIIGVAAVMRNIGHSPALNVRFVSKVIMALGANDIHARQVEYCEFWKKRPDFRGLPGNVIFPGDERAYTELTGMSLDEITLGLSKTPIKGMISPTLIACVDYQFSSMKEHHQTWYAYPLGRPNSTGGWMGFFVPSGTPQGVVLIPSMAGEYAN